ncbi:MAG: YihY/virulence factor BrkB family protein, partial [Rubrivivax sp.]
AWTEVAVAVAVWREVLTDHGSMLAAGLAYHAIFGLLPALAAATALWGLFGDVDAFRRVLHGHGNLVPPEATQVLDKFLTNVPRGFGNGVALLPSLLGVVWTATRASRGLLGALNIVYDVPESRSLPCRFGVALGIALGGIALLFVAVALLALAPLAAAWLRTELTIGLLWLRWPALLALFATALALLFHYGPNRSHRPALPLLCGTAAGTVLCMAASCGIALYVANISRFGQTYGSQGSVAAALLWLYGTSFALLVGAQVDAVVTARHEGSGRQAGERNGRDASTSRAAARSGGGRPS